MSSTPGTAAVSLQLPRKPVGTDENTPLTQTMRPTRNTSASTAMMISPRRDRSLRLV